MSIKAKTIRQEVEFCAHSKVKVLDLSSFCFESLDLSGFKLSHVERLNVNRTGLKDLGFLKSMPRLKYLNINGNGISGFSAVSKLKFLKVLHASSNSIRNPNILRRLKTLIHVDLSMNLIQNESLFLGMINQNKGLEYLNIQHNPMTVRVLPSVIRDSIRIFY